MAKKDKNSALGAMPPEMAAFAKSRAKAFKKGKEAAKEGSTFLEFPDGYYMAALTDADLGQSDSSGRWQVKFEWTILDHEEFDGKQMFNYNSVEDEQSCKYANWFIARLGEEPFGSVEELRERLVALIARRPKCRLQLKTTKSKKDGNDYQNLRIKKVIEDLGDDVVVVAETSKKKKGKKGKKK